MTTGPVAGTATPKPDGVEEMVERVGLAIYRRRHSGNPMWPVPVDKDGRHQQPYVSSVPDWKWKGYDEDARAALFTAPAGDGVAGMVLVSPQKLIALRDALTAGDVSEAYHVLYSIACPGFDKYEPWDSLERLSASTAGGGK